MAKNNIDFCLCSVEQLSLGVEEMAVKMSNLKEEGGSMAEWSAHQTRNAVVPGSSPTLAPCWICSWRPKICF